ncbi:hypothetical protein HYW36_02170 [Candidatus Saccharibacteria bacterium]|nr:hypothetical protein [Candidatus Saccharibacteria bacterium]
MHEQHWRIGHLEVASPWGNAGGVVKTVGDVERMARTGVGYIEHGSTTIDKRLGNKRDKITGGLIIDPETGEPVVDYYHNPETGESFNSLGMPGSGMDVVEKEAPEMVEIAEAYGKKLIMNVAPVTDEPVAETIELVTRAYESGAHGVIVNAGCPNIIIKGAARHEILSHNADACYMVFGGLKVVTAKFPKVYARTSPQADFQSAKDVYGSIMRSDTVSAIWVPNTWPGHRPMVNGKPALTIEGNIGGKSGPATAADVEEQLLWALDILKGSGINVVASGAIANSEALGIKAGEQLKRYMSLGAVAGAGTTFYYEAQGSWEEETNRLLHDFAR